MNAEQPTRPCVDPRCGEPVAVGALLCRACGWRQTQPPPSPPEETDLPPPGDTSSRQCPGPGCGQAVDDALSQCPYCGSLLVPTAIGAVFVLRGTPVVASVDGTILGREHSPIADLVAGSEVVSRRHARLSLVDGVLHIEDLNSTNGTFVNENRIPPNQRLPVAPGDRIRFGKSGPVADVQAGGR